MPLDPVTLETLKTIIGYMAGLALKEANAAYSHSQEQRLNERLAQAEKLRLGIESSENLREMLKAVSVELAGERQGVPLHPAEGKLLGLLLDPTFQSDVADWLMAGGTDEGKQARGQVGARVATALQAGGATPAVTQSLKTTYLDAVERKVFSNPTLAHWRHELSLAYLQEQVTFLRRKAEEAAGVYPQARQEAVLSRYCELALKTWDIIDLSNLPEGEVHIATQALLLRRLYVPLRLDLEPMAHTSSEDQQSTREPNALGSSTAVSDSAAQIRREGTPARARTEQESAPVGTCLAGSPHIVMLGDPGSGKTTTLRWMATAYLLRQRDRCAYDALPDVKTLPDRDLVPVLMKCRDLGETDLCRSFDDFLAEHIKKTELLPNDAKVMKAIVTDRMAKGEALILVDGLDEITSPRVRTQFCQELERNTARYPDCPIVVTSRVYGYREMPHRMGPTFRHGVIADLTATEKDTFAHRWIEVTEQHLPTAERSKHADELIEALHSSDRVELLTRNAMLLTTLALVKRKVGKLPSHRIDLYREAVSVLLNWNLAIYTRIEETEAIPQLEYVAYEMCRRGVQRLPEADVLTLLDALRNEYPNIRPVRNRSACDFLGLLEARSSILVKVGSLWSHSAESPIYEFRHLTLQEYLAARAIVDGRFPGRDKSQTLTDQVSVLAAPVKERHRHGGVSEELDVSDSWRETLRLFVAGCRDDDVDDALLAILKPRSGEDADRTNRPRAVLAALCLADEPNASEHVAKAVLATLATLVDEKRDGGGRVHTIVDAAARELSTSIWSQSFTDALLHEYQARKPEARLRPAGLVAMLATFAAPRTTIEFSRWLDDHVKRICSGTPDVATPSALAVMELAFEDRIKTVPASLITCLLAMLDRDVHSRLAAAWALGWLARWPSDRQGSAWVITETDINRVVSVLNRLTAEEADTARWLVKVLGASANPKVVDAIASQTNTPSALLKTSAVRALAGFTDPTAKRIVHAHLHSPDAGLRNALVGALADRMDRNDRDRILLARDVDGVLPWWDPEEPIDDTRVSAVAAKLRLTEDEVRHDYEGLATKFGLVLSWLGKPIAGSE